MIFTLTTKNVAAGTTLAYVIDGTGDAVGQTTSGIFTVDSSGKAVSSAIAVPVNGTFGDSGTLTLTLSNGKAVSTAVAVTDATLNPNSVVKAISLTTGVDSGSGFTGGTANDTFTADTAAKLGSFDVLDGGAGTDALVVSDASNTAYTFPTAAKLTSIESLTIAHTADAAGATDAVTVDVSLLPAMATVQVANSGSAANVAVTTYANATSVSVDGGGANLAVGTATVNDTNTAPSSLYPVGAKLTTVTLSGISGTSTVTSDVLTTLNLNNTAGLVTVVDNVLTDARVLTVDVVADSTNGGLTDPGATTLNYIADGYVYNTGTLTVNAAKTVSITSNAGIATGVLNAPIATALNISGAASTTLSGVVDLAANSVVTITGAGGFTAANGLFGQTKTINAGAATGAVSLGRYADPTTGAVTYNIGFDNDATYTGSVGTDTIVVGANTKATTTGAGNDTVNILAGTSAYWSTAASTGTIDAGDNTTGDTIALNGDDAATLTATGVFAGKISGFERLAFQNNAGTTTSSFVAQTVNLANLDAINYVTVGAATAAGTLDNMTSGGTVVMSSGTAGALNVNVLNATSSANDALTAIISSTSSKNSTLVASNVETITVSTSRSTALASATVNHTLNLGDDAATTITVSGSAGLNLKSAAGDAQSTDTVLTNFNASGVTNGAVSYTTAALVAAATLTGGAGNDTIDASLATKSVSLNGGAGVDILTGGAGNDTITDTSTYTSADGITVVNAGNNINGGAGADTITAGDGNDTIESGSGNDSVVAGGGNDTITSASGNDTISGGDGDDTITLTSGDNVVSGGAGVDSITAGSGNDNISGDDGNDTILISSTNLTITDTIDGGAGTNTLKISAGLIVDDQFTGVSKIQKISSSTGVALNVALGAKATAAGVATITGGTAADSITLGADFTGAAVTVALGSTAGNIDTVDASAAATAVTVTATAAALSGAIDVLTGGTGTGDVLKITADAIVATVDATGITGFETITIVADGANDVGFTANTLTVATGKTVTVDASSMVNELAQLTLDVGVSAGTFVVTGGAGGDNVDFTDATGNNTANLGAGANTLTGGTGNDSLTVGNGGNTVVGGAGNDTITAGSGNDTITGGTGDDSITAGDGRNTVDGGTGNDTITAGSGNDSIVGGTGNDVITTGTGNDTVTGGAGADSITFSADSSTTDKVIITAQTDSYLATGAATDALAAANLDTLTGFNFSAVDDKGTTDTTDDAYNTISLPTKTSGMTVSTYTLATTTTTKGLADALAASTAFNALLSEGNSDAVVLTVSAGSAAGTYLVIDQNLDGSYTSASDIVIKLSGSVGLASISGNNFSGGASSLMAASYAGTTLTLTGQSTGNVVVALNDNLSVTSGSLGLTVTDATLAYSSGNATTIDTSAFNTGSTVRIDAYDNGAITFGAYVGDVTARLMTSSSTALSGTLTGVDSIILAANVNATMSATSAAKITAASGTNTVTLNTAATAATSKSVVEAYVLADVAGNDITLTAVGQDVTGALTARADTVRTGTLTSFLGTVLDMDDSDDTLIVTTNNTDLSLINAGASLDFGVLSQGTNAVSMTDAQHDALMLVSGTAAITGTGTITITDAASIVADASVGTYVLGNFGNAITLGAAAQNVTGGTGIDTVTTTTGAVTGTLSLGSGNNVVRLTDGANISAATISAAGGTYAFRLEAATPTGARMTVAQHNAATSITEATAGNVSTVTLNDATAAVTGSANVDVYAFAASSGNDFTLGAAGQGVTLSVTAGADTLRVGGLTATGTITNWGIADTLVATTGASIAALAPTAGTLNMTGTVTMTQAQANGFTIVAPGAADTISVAAGALTTIVASAAVEAYIIGNDTAVDDAVAITGISGAQSVTAESTSDTVTVGITGTYTGTLIGETAISPDDIVSASGATNIVGATIGAGFVALTLADATNITMTRAQLAAFTGTLTATGTQSVTLTTAGAVTTAGAIETYNLAAGTNTVTVAGTAAVTVNGGTGADTINIAAATTTFATTLNLGVDTQTDRVSITNPLVNAAEVNVTTISNFNVANDALNLVLGATSTTNGGYQEIVAGANTTITVAANGVIEITGTNLADFTATGDGLAVETALVAAIGQIADGTYTVVMYGGGNAAVYQMTMTDAGADNLLGAAAEIVVEHLVTLTGITSGSFSAANVY